MALFSCPYKTAPVSLAVLVFLVSLTASEALQSYGYGSSYGSSSVFYDSTSTSGSKSKTDELRNSDVKDAASGCCGWISRRGWWAWVMLRLDKYAWMVGVEVVCG